MFATTQLSERPAPFLPAENTAGFDERRYLEARKARYEAILAEIDAKEEAAARAWCAERGLPYVPRVKGLRQGIAEDRLPPKQIGLDPRDFGLERIGRKGLERLKWEFDRYEPVALSVYSGRTPALKAVLAPLRMPADRMKAGELEASHILTGGDPYSPGEPVRPGVLSAVAGLYGGSDEGEPAVIPETIEGRRKALADWIADPRNPLTPRVMVNRIWLVALRPGDRRQPEQLRRDRQEADPPRAARLAGVRVRRPRLVDQGDAPSDHDLAGVPPVVAPPGPRGGRGEGPGAASATRRSGPAGWPRRSCGTRCWPSRAS